MGERVYLTNEQARRFMLLKQGLLGDYRYSGKQGVLEYIIQAGCIQFDPIDVCGRSPELVLHARVKGFKKGMLYSLLYEDRSLLDYFDKNLSIIPTSDWPYFHRFRQAYRDGGRSYDRINEICDEIRRIIGEKGPVSSSNVGFDEIVDWYWEDTRLSRATLETMYFRGELVVHHKKGTIKYYDLAENCIPEDILNRPDPYPNEMDHMKWRVFRRIGGVGLLWNRASDAWLNIRNLKSEQRSRIFSQLMEEGKIIEVVVEGMKDRLYCLSSDGELLKAVLENQKFKARCEFLAPLDNMLWDRKLIAALFGFDYKWEIYTPVHQRRYGHYVLPVLYGDRFAGRVEAICNRKEKTLIVKNFWYEEGVRPGKRLQAAVLKRLKRLAEFNDCPGISVLTGVPLCPPEFSVK